MYRCVPLLVFLNERGGGGLLVRAVRGASFGARTLGAQRDALLLGRTRLGAAKVCQPPQRERERERVSVCA